MLLRIILSIIFGIIFPLVCLVILVFTADYLPAALTTMTFYGKPAPGILFAPFLFPAYLNFYLTHKRILPSIFDTPWFRIISFVLFNWSVYGAIFYFILGRFKRFKRKSVVSSQEPPPPPLF